MCTCQNSVVLLLNALLIKVYFDYFYQIANVIHQAKTKASLHFSYMAEKVLALFDQLQ